MKPKLLPGLALVLSGGLFGCTSIATQNGSELAWPDREAQGPAWPHPTESMGIINERFAHGFKNALGSDGDIAAIHEAITADQPRLNLRVEELRWLSPVLVMAKVRTMEAAYYYVVEKKNGRWSVLTYYLKWIS